MNRFFMKYILLFSSLLLFSFHSGRISTNNKLKNERLFEKAIEAKIFCKKNHFNTDYCILIDMSLHSGKKRAYFYNLNNDSIMATGMCSHGCGSNPWSGTYTKDHPTFSNTPDSHCTSLGKYKTGKRGYSFWGIHVNYLLFGLESTNNNALKREIVFHSWEDIPAEEVFPDGIPEGWGCPAVSNNFMLRVDPILKNSKEPVLLWIFN
jgi:hypothetical protein